MRYTSTARKTTSAIAIAVALMATATGCANTSAQPQSASTSPHQPDSLTTAPEEDTVEESATLKSRIAITYDGGIATLDATTLEPINSIDAAGFLRLSPIGNDRHLAVSTGSGFSLLDMGTWGQKHGDHAHYFTAAPQLTQVVVPAQQPGHVIPEGERVAFFDDATGSATLFSTNGLSESPEALTTLDSPAPHHGFAIPRSDGSIIMTEGTTESRSTVKIVTGDGAEITRTNECPGVHGEAQAAGGIMTVGCEDGVLIIEGREMTKISSPDSYGRIGNQRGVSESRYVLGDYKKDKDAELERPRHVSIIDTEKKTLRLVELPAEYTFRSLEMTEDGLALVLATDGRLYVIDPARAEITHSISALIPWEEPLEWQQPRPALTALDGSIFITDPSEQEVIALDIKSEMVFARASLEVIPNEIEGVLGGFVEHDFSNTHDNPHEGDRDHDHEHEHGDEHERTER